MNKLITPLFLLLALSGLTACAEQPVNAGNSPDEQRSHAQSAQDEMSSEVRK